MKNSKFILLLSLLFIVISFGFNKDSVLSHAGTNSQEIEKFITESKQKGYQDWAEFLLASMPNVDLVNLQSDDFISYFDALKKNLDRVRWQNKINDNLFYYYILPYRVSQEPLENFTAIYVDTLYELVKKTKKMRDAVFRINEWVYTKMKYEPTERWDQNALTTIKRGIGRCEEMSILFIKALRTVCIPARHTYTPWWPFTNSNHAWVELWVDGKWHSLGGGELTDLDNAWFRIPSQRAAIIKSIVFGEKSESNEIIDRKEKDYTIINSTPNYSDVVNLFIQVNKDNLPVESTSVSINVYNYSSLVPVGLKKTDGNGFVQWAVGKTDLFIYAYKDSQIGYQIWRPLAKTNDTVSLEISRKEILDTSFWFYTRKASGQNPKSKYKPNIEEFNNLLNKHLSQINIVDSSLEATLSQDNKELVKIIKDAKGNSRDLIEFYFNLPDVQKSIFVEYFKTLVSKDIVGLNTSDLFQEFLGVQRSLSLTSRTIPDTVIRNYVISPRILYEQLGKWLRPIQSLIDIELPMLQAPSFVISPNEKVDTIFDWVAKNIALKKDGNAFGPTMNPEDIYKAKHATELERYVFITGVLRSIGIPARIKWSEDAIEYWDNSWNEKRFPPPILPPHVEEEKGEGKKLWVGIKFEANNINVTDKTEYYEDYSITRFKESPTRLDPPIDTLNGYAIIPLDDALSYVVSGWRNGFGDTYVRLKKILPTLDTVKYTINIDIPEDVKPGDLIVQEYKGLADLDKLGIKSVDFDKGNTLVIIFDIESEASRSTLRNAWEDINLFQGKVFLFAQTTDKERGQTFLKEQDIYKGNLYLISKDTYKKWGIKDLPSIIYLKDNNCIFWTEGLNLHLSRIIQTFQK